MSHEEWERLVQRLVRERILKSPKVIQAFSRVPRTGFIPERSQSYATVDTPLPIGFGQTISAPHG